MRPYVTKEKLALFHQNFYLKRIETKTNSYYAQKLNVKDFEKADINNIICNTVDYDQTLDDEGYYITTKSGEKVKRVENVIEIENFILDEMSNYLQKEL